MASEIIYNTIDELYPVAGQDNDSQGFRDNFSIIKTGLQITSSEITALQTSSAKLDENNVFSGNTIQEANFLAVTEEVRNNGNVTAGQNISFTVGHYQTIQVGANVALTLTDWPDSGVLGKIRLVITKDNTADTRTVSWNVGGEASLKVNGTWPNPFELTQDNHLQPIIVDFWTSDGGLVVYGQYHGSFASL